MFHFKQFSVDQENCAMKINTDGVLLGALSQANNPKKILDIGTGTGVIALMLAQRFPDAKIDAVEIDPKAAQTAEVNFLNSPFGERLNCFPLSFEDYFKQFPIGNFDMIVSNPPFFINSLKNPNPKKIIARHTNKDFYEKLIRLSAFHLSETGSLWLILPKEILRLISQLAIEYGLKNNSTINISSFDTAEPHRFIVSYSREANNNSISDFVIYETQKKYSNQYEEALKPFFTIF